MLAANLIQESLEKQLQKQRHQLEAKLQEQSEQIETKLEEQSEHLEAKLKKHGENQSEQLEAKLKAQLEAPHGNHTGYLTPPCVSIKVVLDLRECIITGVVGKNSTIHIVVTLSEVDRSCRGVPSSFPYRDCVCVCVCVCGLVGGCGCGCGCGCGWVCECRWVECTCMCECVYSGDYT